VHSVPENHRFPMIKYELLQEQLLLHNVLETSHFFETKMMDDLWRTLTHTPTYWERLKNLKLSHKDERASGFKHNSTLIKRELIITQGTLSIAEHALKQGIGFNIAGGTHHAFTNRPEGFCLLNDFAVTINTLLYQNLIKRALVIDLDVHQGNGTAEIFKNEERVFTFSMHGQENYPFRKEQSDLDVGLATGTNDETYLAKLSESLNYIHKKGPFDLICFQAGVDVLSSDKMGHLNLSIEGCASRDALVYTFARENETPIITSMGGGFSEDIKIILNAHTNTFKTASNIFGF
jgi:acetoin utilization deacetylase AcuC-like enzyme